MKKIIVLLIILLSTGCNSYNDMNDLAIVGTVGVEKQENMFLVTVQVVNIATFNTDSSSSASPIYLINGEGETMYEAIKNLQQKSAKILFPSHVKTFIFDKSIFEEKETLESVIDLLIRNIELSLNFNVVVVTNVSIKDVLSTLSPVENFTASDLEKTIKFSTENYGIGYKLIAKDFYSNYFSYGINNVFSNINVQNNMEEKDKMNILEESDAEVFTYIDNVVSFNKKGEMITLDKTQNFTLNLIQNNFNKVPYVVKCEDDTFTIETSEIKFNFSNFKDDMIDINGNVETYISEYSCKDDLSKNDTLKKLKNLINDSLTKDINQLIDFSKEKENDFIGIGNYIYKNHPKYFDFKNKTWDTEGLKNVNIRNIKIDIKLLKQGNLKGTIYNEK